MIKDRLTKLLLYCEFLFKPLLFTDYIVFINIIQKVYNSLTVSLLEHITASSVIFQVIEEEPWISKEE
jgi:hypothetical protein